MTRWTVLCVVVLLAGCSDSAPSCAEMVKSLEANLKGTGFPVYFTPSQCAADGYSASLRRCLSNARSQEGVERCASGSVQACLQKASGQGAIDRCTTARDKLKDIIDEASASLRLARDKALHAIENYDQAYDRWVEKHPEKRCPASLDELEGELMELKLENASTDPWGSPLVMKCNEKDFWAFSFGPDKVQGTNDDLDSSQVDQSWHRARKKP